MALGLFEAGCEASVSSELESDSLSATLARALRSSDLKMSRTSSSERSVASANRVTVASLGLGVGSLAYAAASTLEGRHASP